MAVLGAVALAGDVDPVFAMGMLEDELVEVGVVLQEIKPAVGNGHVGMREVVTPINIRGSGQADVAGFAKGVLGGIDASNLEVELWASVAGADDNRLARELPEGFEDFFAELLEGRDVLRWNAIVDAKLGGSG